MYQFESRVRYSETDAEANLTLLGILDYFQDAASFHSEDANVGISYMKEINSVWLLLSWQIIVERYPSHGEYIVVKTMPYDMKGCFGYRNFVMETKDGERLAYANSVWSLVDFIKGRPVKAGQEMIDAYGLDEKYDMDYADRKIELPKELVAKEAIRVKEYHLDVNQHVNNGQYTKMAMQFLSKDKKISQLRAEYKKQARLGDVIIPKVGLNDGKMIVALENEEGQAYAIIEFCS